MTPEQVIAETHKMEMAIVEAFGLDPDNVIEGHMRVEGLGLRVDLVKGPPVEFPAKDWTLEQEEDVNGLYEHFPVRWIGPIPARWEVEEMMKP